tara:strand:+ start:213 stop:1151 length:939 start_codon:yes stop_codon:yes gene_type:complete
MIKKKKKILVNDHLFKKENFFRYDLYKKKYEIVFNKLNRSLKNIDLIKILKKNPEVEGVIAGLEKYNFETLKNNKHLKAISRVGVGLDSLDLNYLRSKKIKVFKLTNELTDSVAELYVVLILSILRKIIVNYNSLKKGNWKPIIGNNLKNKKIGIIGFGKVGKKIFKLLKIFNCKFFVYEKNKIYNKNIKQSSLKKIFSNCDIVCISISLNRNTNKIINYDILKNANKNIIIINASRGGVINENTLLSFLKKNKNASAFLDCFTVEPYKGDLIKKKNVFTIPHIASYTHETRREMELASSKKIINYLEKDRL